MFRKALIIGIILPIAVLVLKIIAASISHIEFEEFKPVAVVFLLDISASNRDLLLKQEKTVLQMSKRLDSEDHTRIYIVSEDAYGVYDGPPHKTVAMRNVIEKRSKFDSDAYGTAYGTALKKAVGDILRYEAQGYTPAIVVLGDLENEGDISKQINWNTLPTNIKKTLKYAPDLSLTFLYAHPQKLDFVRETLIPVLGDKRLIVASEENVEQSVKDFLIMVER